MSRDVIPFSALNAVDPTATVVTVVDQTAAVTGSLTVAASLSVVADAKAPAIRADHDALFFSLLDFPIETLVSRTLETIQVDCDVIHGYHKFDLSRDTKRMLSTKNAGGTSATSEAFSFELMHRVFGAALVKCETSIAYERDSSIIDYLCAIEGRPFGVSVTRATIKDGQPMDSDATTALLHKKVRGLCSAMDSVSDDDAWSHSILHVLVADEATAETVTKAYKAMSRSVHRVCTVVVSVVMNAACVFAKAKTSASASKKMAGSKAAQRETKSVKEGNERKEKKKKK